MEEAYSGIKDRQSYVSTSGKDWELVVMDFVNDSFSKGKIPLKVIRGKGLKTKNPELWDNLAIPVNNGKKVEGDVDLIVVNVDDPNVPLAVISCKTSLHGRFSETLFYANVWKQMMPGFIVVFATPDKGRQAGDGNWASEWGTEEQPTKDRQLGEKYLDGIYVKHAKTSYGGKIKKLEELPSDLKKMLIL
jgi:hypothetical protein